MAITTDGAGRQIIIYATDCTDCGHRVRRPFPISTSRIGEKGGGKWVNCRECGHTNHAKVVDPMEERDRDA